MSLLILPGGQYGEKGLVLNLPSNVQLVANQLPQSTRDVNLIGVKYLHESHVADEEWKYFACPSKLLEALNWLKANNKLYANISVDLSEYDHHDRGFHNAYSLNEVLEVESYTATPVNKTIPIANIQEFINKGCIEVP